jgi:hypothetical protein
VEDGLEVASKWWKGLSKRACIRVDGGSDQLAQQYVLTQRCGCTCELELCDKTIKLQKVCTHPMVALMVLAPSEHNNTAFHETQTRFLAGPRVGLVIWAWDMGRGGCALYSRGVTGVLVRSAKTKCTYSTTSSY